MVQKPPIPGVIHLLWPVIVLFTESIFGQDRAIVEAEQRAYAAQGAELNNEVFPHHPVAQSAIGPPRSAARDVSAYYQHGSSLLLVAPGRARQP